MSLDSLIVGMALCQVFMAFPFVQDFDNLAENMVSPPVNRPIARAVANFGRWACDAISANPGLYAPSILQSPLRVACQPYWDSQGYSAPEAAPPPFFGGQCPGVSYSVTYQNFDSGSPFGSPVTFVMGGPVELRKEVTGGSQAFNFYTNNVFVRQAISGAVSSNPNTVVNSISRVDGLPDDCGDLPTPVGPGPNPAPSPGPFPPGTGPIINVRGDTILNLPESIEVSPGVNLTLGDGEVNLGSGTGNTPPGTPLAGEESEGENGGNGGGDNDFGEPPDGERWVGCCVHITQRPAGHGEIPQSVPETIFPDIIGNVRLKFVSTLEVAEYDTPLTNKSKTLCVWEPVRGLRPVGVRVNLRPGFLYSVTPYSVPVDN